MDPPSDFPEPYYEQRPSQLENYMPPANIHGNQMGGMKTDFSKTNKEEKHEKRKALLAQFDDIPIH